VRACPPGLDDAKRFGSSLVPRRTKYYELRNFCISPVFQGGLTLYRPKNWRGKHLKLKVSRKQALFLVLNSNVTDPGA